MCRLEAVESAETHTYILRYYWNYEGRNFTLCLDEVMSEKMEMRAVDDSTRTSILMLTSKAQHRRGSCHL